MRKTNIHIQISLSFFSDILDLDFEGAPASGQDIMISSQEALGVLSALQMSPVNSDASTHSGKSVSDFFKNVRYDLNLFKIINWSSLVFSTRFYERISLRIETDFT